MPRLDCWEVKAEKAANRRLLSKQRKKLKNQSRSNKTAAQELLSMMKKCEAPSLGGIRRAAFDVHIWTDAIPSSNRDHRVSTLHHLSSSSPRASKKLAKKGGGRARSNSESSMVTTMTSSPKMTASSKRRDRSNSESSTGSSGSRRRMHPRSLSHGSSSEMLETDSAHMMCASYFFRGRCSEKISKCVTFHEDDEAKKGISRSEDGSGGGLDGGVYSACHHGVHCHSGSSVTTLAGALRYSLGGNKQRGSNNGISSDEQRRLRGDDKKAEAELKASALAALHDDDDVKEANKEISSTAALCGSIEMLYHLHVGTPVRTDDDDASSSLSSSGPQSLASAMSKTLTENDCGVGSTVYVTLNASLIFDRHRGGVLVTGEEMRHLLLDGGGEERHSRRSTVAHEERMQAMIEENTFANDKESAEPSSQPATSASNLPGQVLEYVLTFIPDESTFALSRVCRNWYNEIGRSSPELWRHLLRRRGWPLPVMESARPCFSGEEDADGAARHHVRTSATPPSLSSCDVHRQAYVSHYLAIRDVNAIQSSLAHLQRSPSSATAAAQTVGRCEAAFQSFKSTQNSPKFGNECVSVRVWSAVRALAAYSEDCTLRLFEAQPTSSSSGSSSSTGDSGGVSCKQSVCVKASPFPSSKKRCCRLVAMDLDDDAVYCICRVYFDHEASLNTETLTVVKRSSLLCAGGGGGVLEGEGGLQSFDLRAAIQDYIMLRRDDDEAANKGHNNGALTEAFFVRGGEQLDISCAHIQVHANIVACGHGRVIFDATLEFSEMSDDESDADDDDSSGASFSSIESAHFLCLFSLHSGTIEFMVDTGLKGFTDVSKVVVHGCRESPNVFEETIVAAVSSQSPFLVFLNVSADGEFRRETKIDTIASDDVFRINRRGVLLTASNVVICDNASTTTSNVTVGMNVLSIYPNMFNPLVNCSARPSAIILDDVCRIGCMEIIRKEHLLAFCEVSQGSSSSEGIYAILVHIPSKREIYRARLGGLGISWFPLVNGKIFSYIGSADHLVAAALFSTGFILTGQNVRDTAGGCANGAMRDGDKVCSRRFKKKQRQPNRTGKKDRFARGMSLRG